MKELNISYIAGLVLRAKASDSDAFAELYALTYNKVYNYTRHYLRDDYLAQDAMQEVFILALKNLHKLNDPTLFIAWLNRISFNVCYDMSNKLKPTSNHTNDPEILEIIQDEHISSNPESNFQKKDENSRLMEALDTLPFNEKQVLIMRYFNEMKLEDIAAAMDISRSSVKRYIASGQDKLRIIMQG
uniref:RNA polymerase sigma factor n=1 Tax=Acetatifactor sp. TaxID=1872090 RepID=UPI004057B399